MLCDTVFDVLAKGVYMKLIVDVHFCVFDAEGRARRQLGELRNLMSVLWDSSSDAIVISARSGDVITSLLSPSFLRLLGISLPEHLVTRRGVAMLLETECHRGIDSSVDNPQGASGFEIVSGSFVDCTEIPYGGMTGDRVLADVDFGSPGGEATGGQLSGKAESVLEASDLVYAAWNLAAATQTETVLMFQLSDRRCEVKVSPHNDDMLVAVIRDVTERFKRLEAERKAHFETVARQKEAQSVR
jgi:PAS domain-containing protein